MTAPLWLVGLLCLLCLYVGAWIGMHMERLFPSNPRAEPRVDGPGLPHDEDDEADELRRRGWL